MDRPVTRPAGFADDFSIDFADGRAADLAAAFVLGSTGALAAAAFFFAAFGAALPLPTALGVASGIVPGLSAAFFGAKRPRPRIGRTGAAASSARLSSSVSVLGSRSLGMRAFFSPLLMYGP